LEAIRGVSTIGSAVAGALFEYLPANNTRGGILVPWDSDLIEVASPVSRNNTIPMMLQMRLTKTSSLIISAYGQNEDSLKSAYLNEPVTCQPTAHTPWLCLGDFNLTYEACDKNNNNLNGRQMSKIKRPLDASGPWFWKWKKTPVASLLGEKEG
jgi:hypothetical protein